MLVVEIVYLADVVAVGLNLVIELMLPPELTVD
jgi:hypothetical protein